MNNPATLAMPKHFPGCGLDTAYLLGVQQATKDARANPWQHFNEKELGALFGFKQVQISDRERTELKSQMAQAAEAELKRKQETRPHRNLKIS